MFSNFFDPTPLSDKELYHKIDEVSLRMSTALQLNMNPNVIDSMQQLINTCTQELINRQAQKELSELGDDPCVFDSDSYLDADKNEEKKKDESKRKSKYKPGW